MIMNNICIHIRSEKNIFATFQIANYSKKQRKEEFFFKYLTLCMESYKKGFDILSTIFRLLGSSNLGFDYFQILEYIGIFEYIRECI